MAPLTPEDLSLLREALEIKLRKEEVEHALGRLLRNKGLDFERYVLITSEVRGSRHKDESTEACARRLISGK
ncbi:MAG: hypothetical protein SA339_00100 [Methanomassiliicoccus sp.]|nr:hypothetical protein [Methanomassiliicoccus sp.]